MVPCSRNLTNHVNFKHLQEIHRVHAWRVMIVLSIPRFFKKEGVVGGPCPQGGVLTLNTLPLQDMPIHTASSH